MKKQPASTTGYDGPKERLDSPAEPGDPVPQWDLREAEYMSTSSSRIVGQVFFGEIAKGIIYFDNKEEFQCLKKLINRNS